MTKDLKLVNITTQDFGSAKDMELHDVRWVVGNKIEDTYTSFTSPTSKKIINKIENLLN